MKKITTAFALLLILFFMLIIVPDFAHANFTLLPPDLPEIYIKSDGSIDPSTAPIQHVGDTYTFTGNITDYTIVIQRDNIVVDGAGFSLTQTPINTSQFMTIDQGWHSANELDQRNNITIKNINFNDCIQGIVFSGSSNINITNNTIAGSAVAAILFISSLNVTVTKNVLTSNRGGIRLGFSTYAITKNTLSKNAYGIGVSGNRIYANKSIVGNIIEGGRDGILLEYCSYDHIEANTIANNSQYGIYLIQTDNCTIYHNNFSNNNQSVFSDPGKFDLILPNFWDNGTAGNYWSNYNGTDNDGDGIGDTPYVIDENNQDNYPLMAPVDIAVISEFPSWTILPLLITATLLIIICKQKLPKTPNK